MLHVCSAEVLVQSSPDSAASRAYYAAFFAVSALFAREGRTFTKHSAVAAAVHRDLAKSGLWPASLGAKCSWLVEARSVGDFGGVERFRQNEVPRAVDEASAVLHAVSEACPDDFASPDDT